MSSTVQEHIIDLIQRNKVEELINLFNEIYDLLITFTADDLVIDFIIGHDHHDILGVLIQRSPSLLLSRTAKKGQTLLHLSISQPSVLTVKMLLTANRFVDDNQFQAFINAQTRWGETALHLAASSGKRDMLELLLEKGADPNIEDMWGRTPGKVAEEQGYDDLIKNFKLTKGIRVHNEDMGNDATSTISDTQLNKQKQQMVTNEFMSALTKKHHKLQHSQRQHSTTNTHSDQYVTTKVKTLFGEVEDRIIFFGDGNSKTPVGFNNNKVTDNLEQKICNNGFDTPAKAVSKVGIALSKLLEYPGDPLAVSNLLKGNDPQYSAVDINGRDMFGLTALHKGSSWNRVELLDVLLLNDEIDVNAVVTSGPYKGFSALHCAIDSNAIGAIDRLLQDPRIDCSLKDAQGRNASEFAAERRLTSDAIALLQI